MVHEKVWRGERKGETDVIIHFNLKCFKGSVFSLMYIFSVKNQAVVGGWTFVWVLSCMTLVH